ncbi:MAG: hypothetical protein K8W52_30010 [Deltaproteobacteria bacterium]|nr:hypothetical protein [Deltaproteobacteria bacterium]
MRSPHLAPLFGALTACTGAPSAVRVELAPSVVSSIDGTTTVTALVSDGVTPLPDEPVHVTLTYRDRAGATHDLAPVDGTTDDRGVFATVITGLRWDGDGAVMVDASGAMGTATFAVLDRTPAAVEILPPTTDLRVGPGLPLAVQVHATDDTGISQIFFESSGDTIGRRATVVASGTSDATATFRIAIPTDATPGPSITLYAMAEDLASNRAAAAPVVLTVDPAITIATPPGLVGTLVTTGTATQLADPRALAVSPHDGAIYVADVADGACGGTCIWRVDPATGAVGATPVVQGQGEIEGVAFDAPGDNLYFTDRQRRTGRLTWNGSAYQGPATTCNNVNANTPQDPYHVVFDATEGLLVVDGNAGEVARIATCAAATSGTTLSNNANLDRGRGIALGPNGELFVSDSGRDEIRAVDRATGAVTTYAQGLNGPYGVEWLGGTSAWANGLVVANAQDRTVVVTTGDGGDPVAYLRNTPIDVALAGGTLYILTSPSATNRGRIYQVTGF